MHKTEYLYGHSPNKYKDLSYVDALKERYIDAYVKLLKLRETKEIWSYPQYEMAKHFTKAIEHNHNLLEEMEEHKWLKTAQKECVARFQTDSTHQ